MALCLALLLGSSYHSHLEEIMEASLKAKWIEALRSGQYRQTQARLRTNDGLGYCCLGVLCEISGQGEWKHGDFITRQNGEMLASMQAGIDFRHAKMFGLEESAKRYLMHANDSGTSFPLIADWIAIHVKEDQ